MPSKKKYLIIQNKRYQKSLEKILSSGKVKITDIDKVLDTLASGDSLHLKHKDHKLHGEYDGYRECHIKPDLLLIYKIDKNILILILLDIGSHADLF
ncbi:MAG: type II toxin-antitoxin system YafQ family toxin [Candidatus Nomurabacteria bacterium]|nr:type II toxin-antitoxin system YafQ family toxin [Candidatus Nomurabacteria bacterium]